MSDQVYGSSNSKSVADGLRESEYVILRGKPVSNIEIPAGKTSPSRRPLINLSHGTKL
jgi:hypothetical protein